MLLEPYTFIRRTMAEICYGCMTTIVGKPPVLVPFVCPICATDNAVSLIALSRAGGMTCPSCKKWLRSQDVMRARLAPRAK